MVKSELVCMFVPVLELRRKAEGLSSPRNDPETGRNTFLSQHVPGISLFGRSGLCLPSSTPLPVVGCPAGGWSALLLREPAPGAGGCRQREGRPPRPGQQHPLCPGPPVPAGPPFSSM